MPQPNKPTADRLRERRGGGKGGKTAGPAGNGLWHRPAEYLSKPLVPLAAVVLFAALAMGGVGTQVAVWVGAIHDMEARLDDLELPERERIAREQAADVERQRYEQAEAERKRQEAEKEAWALERKAERQRKEAEELEKVAAQQAEQRRLEDERARLENERLKLEADKKAREDREAAEKKAREEQERQDTLAKVESERKAAAEAERRKMEDERRLKAEKQGLAYYPLPTTLYKGKNAKEWNDYINDPAGVSSDGIAALVALQDEGIPYLLDLLDGARDRKSHTTYLLAVNPDYVHANDLPKLLDCLNSKWPQDTRIVALAYLSRRKEARGFYAEIADAVSDIKNESNVNGDVRKLLVVIGGK